MQATIRLLSESKGEKFFLTSLLIGLIEPPGLNSGFPVESSAIRTQLEIEDHLRIANPPTRAI
jgi:hypothetical protein